jgi:hypothetical protein
LQSVSLLLDSFGLLFVSFALLFHDFLQILMFFFNIFKPLSDFIMVSEQIYSKSTLFGTRKGIENLGTFLIDTEIATRKWILGDLEENEEDE